jgi:ribose transport system substrate-binding protein
VPIPPRQVTDDGAIGVANRLAKRGVRIATSWSLSLLLLAIVVASAQGCRKDTSSSAQTTTVAPNPAALTGKPLRVAMIAKSSSNPSFLSARTGAEDRARELSVQIGAPIEVDWLTPSQEDGQVQAKRILQAVNDRVDAILISCSDDQKVSDAIDDAVARGVAVMTFDSDAPRSKRFSYCGVDDLEVGQRLMAELARILPARPGVGAKNPAPIAILAGNSSDPNLRRRVEGAMAEAARHPDLKVIGTFFHRETPQDASAEVLRVTRAHPGLAGWAMVGEWPLYNKTLLGDLQSDGSNGQVKIVSVSALPPQLIYVEKGFAPVLLAQPTYLWGTVGIDAIVNHLVLKKPVPERIPMELIRVTSANLGAWARQLKAWGFGDVPDEYLRMK